MPESTPEFIARMRIGGDPVAEPAAQVIAGDARFTVLTERLIRMEFVAGGQFEDRASYAFPNRRADVPDFEASQADGVTSIDTGGLVLRHRPDGRPFHAGNLEVDCDGTRWVPGLRDRQNLGGARRTVDTCRGAARLEPGLASRSGWVYYDDGASLLLGENGWPAARRNPAQDLDWYFFGYGHDYAQAVRDYTRFGGAIPLIPRWMLGAWWSRYWAYSDRDLRELVAEFTAHRFPLDVLVIDMDWHLPDSWTGYTWNRKLLPDPRGFLAWLHRRGLHTTLNLHPALGVQPFEEAYRDFKAAMGVDSDEAIPFRIWDREYARNYFEILHHPLEDDGVDFWWIDWQQGRMSGLTGLDPLPWLNHLHFQDLKRDPARRPVTFSRWGGLGSHRYPIGFSGDTFAQWSALQFQPRYTAAGANVGYAWWSHDIGGHIGADTPELYVRWVQFGALSPILRLHSSQQPDNERRPWMFGADAEAAARAAFHTRYELVPYLYTAARRATDTGIAPIRPMAWIAPEDDNAYAARYQYLFGDSILAAPVVHPAEPSTGLASADVWLPEGNWIERTTGELVTGPTWTRQLVPLDRIPQFVRPGTVLPLAEVAGHTGAQLDDHLVLSVFPGASGSGQVYHDDGVSSGFVHGEFSWTRFSTESPAPDRCTVTVEPADGEGMCRYTIRLEHTNRPLRVVVDGSEQAGWSYEAGRTVVPVAARARSSGLHVEVISNGPLSIAGPEHNDKLRVADLRQVLHDGSLTVADIDQVVRRLPGDSPARAQAVARAGGPLIRIIEYTAPDEAADTLGRIVVAAASTAEVHWRLERHGAVETMFGRTDRHRPGRRRDRCTVSLGRLARSGALVGGCFRGRPRHRDAAVAPQRRSAAEHRILARDGQRGAHSTGADRDTERPRQPMAGLAPVRGRPVRHRLPRSPAALRHPAAARAGVAAGPALCGPCGDADRRRRRYRRLLRVFQQRSGGDPRRRTAARGRRHRQPAGLVLRSASPSTPLGAGAADGRCAHAAVPVCQGRRSAVAAMVPFGVGADNGRRRRTSRDGFGEVTDGAKSVRAQVGS